MFIALRIDRIRCSDGAACTRCVDVCPVDVFRLEEGKLMTDPDSEDECTLCELCVQSCPRGALRLVRLYEE